MLTSFGSFPVLYLIERYVFESVFHALIDYFNLKMPIKMEYRNFFKKLISLIQKATNYVVKEQHKIYARELFKVIKKIPGLKDLGGDQIHSKNLAESGEKDRKTKGAMNNLPILSQAMKLKAYIQSCSSNDMLQHEVEKEFEGLVHYII